MGLWDRLCDAGEWFQERVSDIINWFSNKFGESSYDDDILEDQIDVDKELRRVRDSMKENVDTIEEQCMGKVGELFTGLKRRSKERFPDLVELIESKQEEAEKKLKGTILRYVKKHLSKNDKDFLEILEMQPGYEKKMKLEWQQKQVLEEAQTHFYKCLVKQVKDVQQEFELRLKTRLEDQENQMKERIARLEILEQQMEKGTVDYISIKNRIIPIMEVAECISTLLETENNA